MTGNKESLIKELIDLGLSDKEARVYLAALGLKQASVQKIARSANIKRVTTYVILESLMGKGLVSRISKNNKTEFLVEEPSNLARLIDDQLKKLERSKSDLSKFLPDLKRMHELPEEVPEVRYLVGHEALKTVFEENLKQLRKIKGAEIYTLTSYDRRRELYNPDDYRDFYQKRRGIPVRAKQLYTGEPIKEFQNPLSEYRRIEGPIEADFNIYKDTVIIVSYVNPPVAVIINDATIAVTLRHMFETMWQTAAPAQAKALKKVDSQK